MKEITFRRAFGYCTMVGMLVLGGLVLMGFVLNPQTPSRLRTMMGVFCFSTHNEHSTTARKKKRKYVVQQQRSSGIPDHGVAVRGARMAPRRHARSACRPNGTGST